MGGGVAGHNGLRSISAHIGNEYKRVRIGIAFDRAFGFYYPDDLAELEAAGIRFRGTSDTEVMVEGFSRWGVKPTSIPCSALSSFTLMPILQT